MPAPKCRQQQKIKHTFKIKKCILNNLNKCVPGGWEDLKSAGGYCFCTKKTQVLILADSGNLCFFFYSKL